MDEPRVMWILGNWAFAEKRMADAHARTCGTDDKPVRYVPAESMREVLEAAKDWITRRPHTPNCRVQRRWKCTCGRADALRLIEEKLKEDK